MIDIILVNPNYNNEIFGEKRLHYLPVGLGYIARSLQKNKFEYEVVDLNFENSLILMKRIEKYNPLFVGFSMMSYKAQQTYSIIKEVKHRYPNIKVIVGGPHVIATGKEIFEECECIDILIRGEGEKAIVQILQGVDLFQIKGLIHKTNNRIHINEEQTEYIDINSTPFPNYNKFKLLRYQKTMQLNSSRGCVYKCTFCGARKFLGSRWRARTAEKMHEEFLYWYKKGYRSFNFSDSLFSADKKRIIEFCDYIIRNKYKVEFIADGVRADHLNYEVLLKMKKANFTSVTFGVESANEHILKILKKGETLKKIENTILMADKLDFKIGMFFIIGSPKETREHVENSFRFALKYPNTYAAHFFKLTPIPGTEYFEYAMKKGYITAENKYPSTNFGMEKKSEYGNDKMSTREFNNVIHSARILEQFIRYRYAVKKIIQLRFKLNIRNTCVLNIISLLLYPQKYSIIDWFKTCKQIGHLYKSKLT